MGMNLTYFDAALKDVYGPRVEEELSIRNVLTDYIEENDSADWTGRQVTYPIHVGRNQGVGASAEGSRLPPAGYQQYAQVKIAEKYNYGRIELTGQVIKSSLDSKGAFTRAMESEIRGLVRDMANDRERQFFGSGKGVLALVNGQQCMTATTTLNVDSPFGVSPTTNGGRFFNANMTCVVIDPTTDTTIEGTISVSSVAAAGTSIVISATQSTTFSDNARITRYNSDVAAGTTNNLNYEVMGLLGIIDDGTYQNTLSNINRTTYPIFKSSVITDIGSLTLDVMQRGVDASDEIGGGNFATDGVMFAHHSARREYLKLLQADRRYMGADLKTPDGGTRQAALRRGGEITFGDRPMRIAKHAPYGTIFGMLKGSITRYIHVRGEWADEDDSIFRNVANYDKWEAFYRIFDNLHSDRPNDCFRLDGITVTVGTPNHIY
jgi:hypothetical protein